MRHSRADPPTRQWKGPKFIRTDRDRSECHYPTRIRLVRISYEPLDEVFGDAGRTTRSFIDHAPNGPAFC